MGPKKHKPMGFQILSASPLQRRHRGPSTLRRSLLALPSTKLTLQVNIAMRMRTDSGPCRPAYHSSPPEEDCVSEGASHTEHEASLFLCPGIGAMPCWPFNQAILQTGPADKLPFFNQAKQLIGHQEFFNFPITVEFNTHNWRGRRPHQF